MRRARPDAWTFFIAAAVAWALAGNAEASRRSKRAKHPTAAETDAAEAPPKMTLNPDVQTKARAAGLGKIPDRVYLQKNQHDTDLASQFVVLGIEGFQSMASKPQDFDKDTLATMARALLKSKIVPKTPNEITENGKIHLPPKSGSKTEVIWLARNPAGRNIIDINLDRVFDTVETPNEAERKAIVIHAYLVSEGMDETEAKETAEDATGTAH